MGHFNLQHRALESVYEGLCEVLGPGAIESRLIRHQLEMRPKAEPAAALGNVCVCVEEGGGGEWRELKARNSLAITRAFESRTL